LAIAAGEADTFVFSRPTAARDGRCMMRRMMTDEAVRNGDTMKLATTKGLYDYWNAVRGARLAPRRYEIEPSQIVPFLSETFILERPDDEECRVRVAGTRIGEWLGQDIRGALFFDLWRPEDRVVLMDNVTSMCAHGGVGLFEFEVQKRDGDCAATSFEMLLLPLTHLGEDVERVLGSISIIEDTLFNGDMIMGLSLTHNKILWPDGRPHGIAREAKASGTTLAVEGGFRRARLVRSDRRRFLVYDGGRSGE
jgi:hypothetical protein